MEAAKAAVAKFTNRKGHTTDVEETVRPAIVSETIKPHRHEETIEAVDREVHQDHYHTTVQPIAHREVIPEVHTHNAVPIVNREFEHDDRAETDRRISTELGAFKNTSIVHDTTHSREAAATVTGEHVHHHVHETVQPVIHKETIRPEVVHTTIPIHETHHAAATHHGISALPMKTLDEFKRMGGSLVGGTTTTSEHYEGQPRQYNPALETSFDKLGLGHGHHGTTGSHGLPGTHGTTGTTGTHGLPGTHGTHGTHGTGAGVGTGVGAGAGAAGLGAAAGGRHGRHRSDSASSVSSSDISENGTRTHRPKRNQKKPGLMDRLNPRTDADGDGRVGIGK